MKKRPDNIKIGVLALQGAVKEHIVMLEKCNVNAVEIRDTKELEKVKGLIIPGGESTTVGMLMDRYGFTGKIKKLYNDKELAIMGTCTGLIILSNQLISAKEGQRTLGLLDVRTKRNAFGRQAESFQAEIDIDIYGKSKFPGIFIRAPIVSEISKKVKVIAKYENFIVGVKQDRCIGLAFHPELTDDTRFHKYFIDSIVSGKILQKNTR